MGRASYGVAKWLIVLLFAAIVVLQAFILVNSSTTNSGAWSLVAQWAAAVAVGDEAQVTVFFASHIQRRMIVVPLMVALTLRGVAANIGSGFEQRFVKAPTAVVTSSTLSRCSYLRSACRSIPAELTLLPKR
jgi:hypothetical protein